MVHRTCTCTYDIGAGTSTLPRVGPKDFDQWINNEACGPWRFFMMKNEPSVILYPTTMTRVPENLDAWRDYKSDAHYPMSFKLAPPQERKQQQIVDMTLAAMHPNQLGDGAASPVAEASPKPAQPQPPPPRRPGMTIAISQRSSSQRSVGLWEHPASKHRPRHVRRRRRCGTPRWKWSRRSRSSSRRSLHQAPAALPGRPPALQGHGLWSRRRPWATERGSSRATECGLSSTSKLLPRIAQPEHAEFR